MTSGVDNTALLVMDVQDGIVERLGNEEQLERVSAAVASARGRDVRVIFVRVAFRDGYPEVSARNKTFSAIRGAGAAMTEANVGIHAAVAPVNGETVVTKRRVSAFAGSDLDVVLRAGGITHLVL